MWFKRRKKTEQDHALSESLRSLQSLLSETGRHEPSLDADSHPAPADDTGTGESDVTWPVVGPAAGPALAAGSGNGNRPRPDRRDAPAAEPEAPGGSGNRWRDLNLSFDAEPVTPRARRDTGTDDATAPSEPALDADPGSEAAAQVSESDDAESETGTPVDTAYGLDPESTEDAGVPEPDDEAPEAAASAAHDPRQKPAPSPPDSGAADSAAGGDASIITDQNRHDDDYGLPSRAEDEFLVLDLEDPRLSPPAGAEDGAPSAGEPTEHQSLESSAVIDDQLPEPGDDADLDDTATYTVALESPPPEPPPDQPAAIELDELDEEHEATTREEPAADAAVLDVDPLAPAPGDTPAGEPPAEEPAAPGDDEQAEDQLHLELEASAESEADIPVLTNAVYVPEPPQEQEAAPGPPESPHEEPIARCIDNFRVRLQLMGLDTLSTAQEKELHDSLVEFLDEIEHD